jgi:hypothetical protein
MALCDSMADVSGKDIGPFEDENPTEVAQPCKDRDPRQAKQPKWPGALSRNGNVK